MKDFTQDGKFTSLSRIWPHVEVQRKWGVIPAIPCFYMVQGQYTHGIAGTRDS